MNPGNDRNESMKEEAPATPDEALAALRIVEGLGDSLSGGDSNWTGHTHYWTAGASTGPPLGLGNRVILSIDETMVARLRRSRQLRDPRNLPVNVTGSFGSMIEG